MALALILFMVLVFGICLDVYYLYKLPSEGLNFVLLGAALHVHPFETHICK